MYNIKMQHISEFFKNLFILNLDFDIFVLWLLDKFLY